ncbi:MAG: phosphopantothenoylcysteine decarboxylase [Phycisphaerae bacterium]|nr:phosphopantothenoylcysteine decarboxylase [Phycisphaerae bacterium]
MSPERILITAGPTSEPVDAVRSITNRSSGRLGVALARAAIAAGHPTTLLLGPIAGPAPTAEPVGVDQTAENAADQNSTRLAVHRFTTTAELQHTLAATWPDHDVLIMAAAVADFRPVPSRETKIRRSKDGFVLHLEPTPDLLAELASTTRPDQTLIGFALEPRAGLLDAAREKMTRKGVDAIVANPLETMDAEDIDARVLLAGGVVLSPGAMSKVEFAAWLIATLPRVRHVRGTR